MEGDWTKDPGGNKWNWGDYTIILPTATQSQHRVVVRPYSHGYIEYPLGDYDSFDEAKAKALEDYRIKHTGANVEPNPSHDGISGSGSKPDNTIPDKITREMNVDEIIAVLCKHKCNDVTEYLDKSRHSEYPVSQGGFGDVYRGYLLGGDTICLKTLRLRTDSTDGGKKLLKHAALELYVWSKCDHPNVLKLTGIAKYRGQVAMVSPWMENGDLRWFLSRNPQVDRYALCIQIADGVAYLHAQGIVHGDIKGVNILVSQEQIPKLTDFGNASLKEYSLQFTNTTGAPAHSLRWTAPEILDEKSGHSVQGDVYALGMTILETITGSIPYNGLSDTIVIKKLAERVHPTRPEDHMPASSKKANLLWPLLVSCWAYDPVGRPTAAQVCNKMKEITSVVGS